MYVKVGVDTFCHGHCAGVSDNLFYGGCIYTGLSQHGDTGVTAAIRCMAHGCRYKSLVFVFTIHHNKGRDFMADISSPSSITIGELSRIVNEFEEKFKDGTEDPDRF